MTLYQAHSFEIPAETIEVAQAAFPKGNVYLTIRDKLGPIFSNEEFADLFSWQGQTGVAPGLLAMVIVMEYMEGLTDRQAADAVRSRIDWKYLLGLHLTDSGFDYSILCPFRDRLLEGGRESLLFDKILRLLKEHNLLTGKKRQRTDSSHVLAAIRTLNRLECVGESLRRVLNDLAQLAPEWLLTQISPDWFDRYGARLEAYRFPDKQSEREALQLQVGQDGSHLLTAIFSDEAPGWLREIASVGVMCQIWIQQYYVEAGQLKWRDNQNLPPHNLLIVSPDDIEARNRTKRETNWSGYAVHLTETCAPDSPNLITNVETTPATTGDANMTEVIHQALADKDLLPEEHLVDTAYMSVDHLLNSQRDHNIDLIGPMAGGKSWQTKTGKGFDVSCFAVDWETQTVTCPQGKTSQNWQPRTEKHGHEYFHIRFDQADCHPCPHRTDCTRSKRGVRAISLKPQTEYETLRAARERQETPEFKATYNQRAGIEGTISQGVRAFELRRSRYLGLAKTHLQHLATAAAINLTRAFAWWSCGETRPPLYRSPFAKLAPTVV